MNKKLLGIIRHLLTFGGGFVVAKGWLPETALPEVVGSLMTVIGAVWSISDKKES